MQSECFLARNHEHAVRAGWQEAHVLSPSLPDSQPGPCGSSKQNRTEPASRKCTGWKDWRHNCYDPKGRFDLA